eukprot:13917694-Ditylum_brightwellii.AAC.1
MEALELKRDKVTMMSRDIKNMYPSVRLQLIRNALKYYACNLLKDDKKTTDACLEMIKFGMQSMLIQYNG